MRRRPGRRGITVPERWFPFITVVTGDRYDAASRLDRDAASFRVTIGVDRAAYEALSGCLAPPGSRT